MPTKILEDYYSILNLSKYADISEVESSYQNLKSESSFWRASSTENIRYYAKLQEAHNILSNELDKAKYDARLKEQELSRKISIQDNINKKLILSLEAEKERGSSMEEELSHLLFKLDSKEQELISLKEENQRTKVNVNNLNEELNKATTELDFYLHQNKRLLAHLKIYQTNRNKIILVAVIISALSIITLIINTVRF